MVREKLVSPKAREKKEAFFFLAGPSHPFLDIRVPKGLKTSQEGGEGRWDTPAVSVWGLSCHDRPSGIFIISESLLWVAASNGGKEIHLPKRTSFLCLPPPERGLPCFHFRLSDPFYLLPFSPPPFFALANSSRDLLSFLCSLRTPLLFFLPKHRGKIRFRLSIFSSFWSRRDL